MLEASVPKIRDGPPPPVTRAITGRDGRFRLEAPSAGVWKVRVEASGFVPIEASLQPLIERVDLPDAELTPDTGLQVRIVDGAGAPISGARVTRSRAACAASVNSIPAARSASANSSPLRSAACGTSDSRPGKGHGGSRRV